jgi:hypothetical protein
VGMNRDEALKLVEGNWGLFEEIVVQMKTKNIASTLIPFMIGRLEELIWKQLDFGDYHDDHEMSVEEINATILHLLKLKGHEIIDTIISNRERHCK